MRHTNRRIVTAALVPTLALGGIGLGTAATAVLATAGVAAAAQSGAWSTPTPMPGIGDGMIIKDLVTRADGSAVAVWYHRAPGSSTAELLTSIRPAKSTVWDKPVQLDMVRAELDSVRLWPASDGSVSLTWVGGLSSPTTTVNTAMLAKGATTWSQHADIAYGSGFSEVGFAHDPASGKRVAVWRRAADDRLYVSESADGRAWSEPVAGATTTSGPQVAVAPNGTFTVAWLGRDADGRSGVLAMDKAPGAARWGSTVSIAPPDEGGAPLLAVGADGTAALTWTTYGGGDDSSGEDAGYVVTAVRPAGATAWSALEKSGYGGRTYVQAPLIGANGDVTFVWSAHYSDGVSVSSVTRTAGGGWSAIQPLGQGWITDIDASMGADGTIQVGWAQSSGTSGRDFFTVARIDGVWAAGPKRLSTASTSTAQGAVAVGPDGNVTAVWAQGAQLYAAGTGLVPVPPRFRDYAGWSGNPDLYSRSTRGGLVVHHGNANQTLYVRSDGGSWPTSSLVLPFGDLDRDGCNDTLVRTGAGALYRYSPACGQAVTPTSPATKIGSSGWGAFDVLTYSGDFTGDRLPDLVARQASTGDLYLYQGTTTGRVSKVGKIATGWKTRTVVGSGDLNGDGHADLVARTSTGSLYRYFGTGAGAIGSGVRVGSGWGGMVDIVGIGDLTMDGKNDLVARNTAGDLFRYAGTGTGGFGAGVKIGTGWQYEASIR
ncbi:VCBS repeat-containing protein [Streptomyces sp. NPDC048629]